MSEFADYDMNDIFFVLNTYGINWDGRMKDYIYNGDGGFEYNESPATIDLLKDGSLSVADKRFAFLHVTPYSFNFNYCGHNYNATDLWTSHLSNEYESYIPQSKEYLENRLLSLAKKLSKQDEKSMISSIIRDQMDDVKENLERMEILDNKKLGDENKSWQ